MYKRQSVKVIKVAGCVSSAVQQYHRSDIRWYNRYSPVSYTQLARKKVDRAEPEVCDALENVIQGHPVICLLYTSVARKMNVNTNDTICDSARVVKFAPMTFPKPCYKMCIRDRYKRCLRECL